LSDDELDVDVDAHDSTSDLDDELDMRSPVGTGLSKKGTGFFLVLVTTNPGRRDAKGGARTTMGP